MAHISTLRDFKFKGEVDDIRGATLYGRGNEKLGKVDDVVFDHAGGFIQYLVVDTGGWLSSNKFLVPADRVNAHAESDRDFTCDLSKEQIERFPEYKDTIIRDEKDWQTYESRYRGHLDDSGDVLHRPGSDRLITPEVNEMPASIGSSEEIGIDATPTRLVHKFTDTGVGSDKTRLRPAGIAARAEDTKNPGSSYDLEESAWRDPSAISQRNRRATDSVDDQMEPAAGSIPAPVDPELNRNIASISSKEDIGDVDINSSSDKGSAFGERDIPVPAPLPTDPPSYRVGEQAIENANMVRNIDPHGRNSEGVGPNDVNAHVGERYSSNRRLRDFEESLRRNRVDIAASCRACGVEKNEDEEAA